MKTDSEKIAMAWKILEGLTGGQVEAGVFVAGCLVFFETPNGTVMVNLDMVLRDRGAMEGTEEDHHV